MIDEVSAAVGPILQQRPNVVLLHLGTNDMIKNVKIANAPARMSTLIDKIYFSCPDAVILVAKVMHSRNETITNRIIRYNIGLETVIKNHQDVDKHILGIDMDYAIGPSDFSDDTHPNDVGYEKMARKWYHGIRKAARHKWIRTPFEVSPYDLNQTPS